MSFLASPFVGAAEKLAAGVLKSYLAKQGDVDLVIVVSKGEVTQILATPGLTEHVTADISTHFGIATTEITPTQFNSFVALSVMCTPGPAVAPVVAVASPLSATIVTPVLPPSS